MLVMSLPVLLFMFYSTVPVISLAVVVLAL
jgi:hypothetical protein